MADEDITPVGTMFAPCSCGAYRPVMWEGSKWVWLSGCATCETIHDLRKQLGQRVQNNPAFPPFNALQVLSNMLHELKQHRAKYGEVLSSLVPSNRGLPLSDRNDVISLWGEAAESFLDKVRQDLLVQYDASSRDQWSRAE